MVVIFISDGIQCANDALMASRSSRLLRYKGDGILKAIGLILMGVAITGVLYFASQSARDVLNPQQPDHTLSVSSALSRIVSVENQIAGLSNTHKVIIPFKAGLDGYYAPDKFYQPGKLELRPGDSVEWINEDTVIHTASSSAFNSGALWPAGSSQGPFTFEHTFHNPGTYYYTCELHPQMIGEVIVK